MSMLAQSRKAKHCEAACSARTVASRLDDAGDGGSPCSVVASSPVPRLRTLAARMCVALSAVLPNPTTASVTVKSP